MSRHKSTIPHDIERESATAFAGCVLQERTQQVRRWLRRAAKCEDGSARPVHQLRVATRRAVAALVAFKALVRRKRAKRLQRELKRLRSTAGGVRNADVLLPYLADRKAQLSESLFAQFAQQISVQRNLAQRAVERKFRKSKRRSFKRLGRRCVEAIRWRGRADREPSARDQLAKARRVAIRGLQDLAGGSLQNAGELHALRLQCKALRYVLELEPAAKKGNSANPLVDAIKETQDRLGKINDRVSANRTLQEWLARWADQDTLDELREFVESEESAVDQEIVAFREWWADRDLCELAEREL